MRLQWIISLVDGTLELPVVIYYQTRTEYLPLLVHYKLVICSDTNKYVLKFNVVTLFGKGHSLV